MNNTKILVTGGCGFIGSNLVNKLVESNNNVVVLDNFLSGHRSNLKHPNDLEIIYGDVRDDSIVKKAIKNVEVVFHLAASVGNKRSIDFPIIDAQTNVIGTLNILEASKNEGVRKIVTSSSAGIFGELKTIPIKEDHIVEPDSPYGCTKLCEEKLCLSYAKLYDFESICLRYFNVYGPNQRFDAYGNVIPIFVYRMISNEPVIIFGDGNQTRDFVHVDDIVQANLKAAQVNGINGAFNIASGTSISINELVKIISKNSKNQIKIEYQNPRSGDVLHSLADISSAKKHLNYFPLVELNSGINEYIEWARNFYS